MFTIRYLEKSVPTLSVALFVLPIIVALLGTYYIGVESKVFRIAIVSLSNITLFLYIMSDYITLSRVDSDIKDNDLLSRHTIILAHLKYIIPTLFFYTISISAWSDINLTYYPVIIAVSSCMAPLLLGSMIREISLLLKSKKD